MTAVQFLRCAKDTVRSVRRVRIGRDGYEMVGKREHSRREEFRRGARRRKGGYVNVPQYDADDEEEDDET